MQRCICCTFFQPDILSSQLDREACPSFHAPLCKPSCGPARPVARRRPVCLRRLCWRLQLGQFWWRARYGPWTCLCTHIAYIYIYMYIYIYLFLQAWVPLSTAQATGTTSPTAACPGSLLSPARPSMRRMPSVRAVKPRFARISPPLNIVCSLYALFYTDIISFLFNYKYPFRMHS